MVQAGTRHDFVKTKEYRGPSVPSPLTNNPRAGQWTNAMSHNMIADYKRFLMTDGEGIRCSLYVSGCPFHCEGCYNSSIWDFQAGHEYNERLEAQIMDDLAQSFVQGITFLGGEPLLNTGVLLPLARTARRKTSSTCFMKSTFSLTAAISRRCTIHCCSSAVRATSAFSTCRSRSGRASRWCGRNCTTRSVSFPKSTARSVPPAKATPASPLSAPAGQSTRSPRSSPRRAWPAPPCNSENP